METFENMVERIQKQRPKRLRWHTALDNYEPMPRDMAYGRAIEYNIRNPQRDERGVMLYAEETPRGWPEGVQLKDAKRAVYILDDGQTVRPMYVAGYQEGNPSPLHPDGCEPFIILHPFPTNGPRADGQGMADFSTWMLGPRRAYHLKVQE